MSVTWLRRWSALLGIYFVYYTAALWPYRFILFGCGPGDSPCAPATVLTVNLVFALRALSAGGLAAGIFRRYLALMLYLTNALLSYWDYSAMGSPELPFLNFQLLLVALIPDETDENFMHFSRIAVLLAWIQMGIGFFGAGWQKATAHHGSWLSGNALQLILTDHIIRRPSVAWIVQSLPANIWRLFTWTVVGSQLAMLPALATRRTRIVGWTGSFAVQVGAIGLLDLMQVSVGMCVALLFLLPLTREDGNVVELARRLRTRAAPAR